MGCGPAEGAPADSAPALARIGPFPAPELAMLVAVVAMLLLVNLVLPGDLPRLVTFAVPILAAVVVGTEVYVRAWPATSRRGAI